MARLARLDVPKVPQHVVQRGNNRQALFFHDDDYSAYLGYLREGLLKHDCRLYAFVLMTNHVHLLARAAAPGAISGLMQSLGRRYVRYVNVTYRRTGTLFEGRFKSSVVDSERYLLMCMRYIELNPARAGLVTDPGDYRWSSYRLHVGETVMNWLAEPKEYRRLGASSGAYSSAFGRPFQSDSATDSSVIRPGGRSVATLGVMRLLSVCRIGQC